MESGADGWAATESSEQSTRDRGIMCKQPADTVRACILRPTLFGSMQETSVAWMPRLTCSFARAATFEWAGRLTGSMGRFGCSRRGVGGWCWRRSPFSHSGATKSPPSWWKRVLPSRKGAFDGHFVKTALHRPHDTPIRRLEHSTHPMRPVGRPAHSNVPPVQRGRGAGAARTAAESGMLVLRLRRIGQREAAASPAAVRALATRKAARA